MQTITIQIGNSDDKLTQLEWHNYVTAVTDVVRNHTIQTHFFGGSPNWFPWQNTAWVIQVDSESIEPLRDALVTIRKRYDQESIAFTIGKTEFA